jgi:hypothetical protein
MNLRSGLRARSRKAGPSGLFVTLLENNKMDIFSSFATDEKLENEGKVFPLSKTAKVKVARSGNTKYVTQLRKKMAEAQLDLATGEEADQLAEGILVEVMAETILVGWSGISENGVDVPYSVAKAAEYLKIKDFRRKISALSENFESFKLKAEVEQKNG